MRMPLGAIVISSLLLCYGCVGDAESPSPSSAEVPGPGPAVIEDPGPAPDGQWEPPVEEDENSEPNDPAVEPSTDEVSTQSTPESDGGGSPQGQADVATELAGVSASHEDGQISLNMQTWDQTEQLIASHKGKVVVVDFWATSCLPCRREFPHLVELQKSFGDDIACVSVSLDYSGRKSRPPEIYREPVLEFLTEQGARFDNVLSTDDPDELQQRLELPPIPLVWVYDQNGKRRESFHNADRGGEEFTYADHVKPFVQSLVDEK